VPLVAGDATDCPYCQKRVEIPAAYRELRDAEAKRVESDSAARQLYAELARRPAWILRAIQGWFSWVALALGVYPAMFIASAAVLGSAQVAVAWVASHRPTENLIDTGTSAFVRRVMGISALYSAPLGFVFIYVGSTLGVYGRKRTISRLGLQNALAARTAHAVGGSSECRICGAPLVAKDDEIGVACQYCRADNLLIAPPPVMKAMNRDTLRVARETHSAQAALTAERTRTRAELRRYVLWLSVVSPLPAFWFWQMARDAPRPVPPSFDDWPPNYALYRRSATPMIVERTMADKPGNLLDYPKGRRWAAKAHCAPGETLVETTLPSVLCGERCVFQYYAPLARGDVLALVASDVPDGASVRIEQHVSSEWEADVDWLKSSDPFGPVVLKGPLLAQSRVQVSPKSDAWHRILVSVPYELPEAELSRMNEPRKIALCFEISAAH